MKYKFKRIISILTSLIMVFTMIPFLNVYESESYDYLSYGIDVSKFQSTINWEQVAQTHIDFAIIRAGTTKINGETYSQDSYFETNYNGAKAAGLNVGSYFYCGAYTEAGFKQCTLDFLGSLSGKSFEFPVYIDIEQASNQQDLGKSVLTTYILSSLDLIKNAGYRAGVYANKDWFTNYIDISRIKSAGYEIWWAQYPSGSYAVDPTEYDKSSQCGMWQYSSKGSVSGITGDVDLNVSYVNYSDNEIPPKPPVTSPDDGGYWEYTYFPACDQSYISIVEALKSIGFDSLYEYRAIAELNGINNYTGTAEQNLHLLKLLKEGKLIKSKTWVPVTTTSTTSKTTVVITTTTAVENVECGYVYYPACEPIYTSLVDALNSINVDSSYVNRSNIAEINGIIDYSGTAKQNTCLLDLLKQGKLIKSKTWIPATNTTTTKATTTVTSTFPENGGYWIITYFPACDQSNNSIVEALKSIGFDSSYEYRKTIAELNGIINFSGTAEQNLHLLKLLKQGKLIKSKTWIPATNTTTTKATTTVTSTVLENGGYWIITYFPAPNHTSYFTSIVDALKSMGFDSSYEYRKTIAELNGISNYTGTAAQNAALLNLFNEGKLIKSKVWVAETGETTTTTTTETVTPPVTTEPVEGAGIAGDANEDGKVDLKDVILIRRCIAGGWDVKLNEINADVNDDSVVDLKDVIFIRRYIAGGWDVELK